jgi:hypothetical protein
MDGGDGAIDAYQRAVAATRRLAESKRDRPGPDVMSWLLAHHAEFTVDEADAVEFTPGTGPRLSCLRAAVADGAARSHLPLSNCPLWTLRRLGPWLL